MSQKDVERTLGRSLMDASFRRVFFRDPARACLVLGVDLAPHEREALLDLRSALDVTAAPFVIPGAVRIVPDELVRRHRDIPPDRDIVVYCSWPNVATSARVAVALKRRGVTRVRPLEGGLPWVARSRFSG
jgi:rhodanese-related sulfurtransferase